MLAWDCCSSMHGYSCRNITSGKLVVSGVCEEQARLSDLNNSGQGHNGTHAVSLWAIIGPCSSMIGLRNLYFMY